MSEGVGKITSATNKFIDTTQGILTNKRSRSVIWLIISAVSIILMNGLIPALTGDMKCTESPSDGKTYGDYCWNKGIYETELQTYWLNYQSYVDRNEPKNRLYKLTYKSNREITSWKKVIDTNKSKEESEQWETESEKWNIIFNKEVIYYTKMFYESPSWYVTTSIALASALLLFYSLFNYLLRRERERNARFLELSRRLDTLVDEDLDPTTFEPWMTHNFNVKRKRQQHIANVKYKLEHLEQRTSYLVRNKLQKCFDCLNSTHDENLFNEMVGQLNLNNKDRRYLRKKLRLLSLLREGYIEEYVDNGRVKYFKYIHPTFVYSGRNEISRSVDAYSLIKNDGERLGNDAGAKVLVSIGFSILCTALSTFTIFASVEDPGILLIVILARLVSLLAQVPLAFDYTNTYMQNHLIGNLLHRRTIALLYLADLKKEKEGGNHG